MNYYDKGMGLGLSALGQAADDGMSLRVTRARPSWGTMTPIQKAGAIGGFASTPVLAYHGYKRNRGSIGWTLVWGLFGAMVWPITVPIAFAQGYGKPKVTVNRRRRRAPTRRRRTSRRRRRTSRRR